MQRVLFFSAAGVILLGVILMAARAPVDAADGKADVPSTEKIMQVINKPKGGLHRLLGKALEEESVKWDDVAKMTKEYAELAGALGKNPCPKKGTLESWTKLCKAYGEDAKSLDSAAGKKDKEATIAAWTKLNRSCQSCHDEHRGEP